MKCICRRKVQVRREDGKIVTHDRNSVVDFKKCPNGFEPLEGSEIDFGVAEKEELLEADYKLDDLKDYIEEKFGKKAGNKGQEKTVALLLDCRYRATDLKSVI